jgi:hypothetical protein
MNIASIQGIVEFYKAKAIDDLDMDAFVQLGFRVRLNIGTGG